jgi:hypothetical protein
MYAKESTSPVSHEWMKQKSDLLAIVTKRPGLGSGNWELRNEAPKKKSVTRG